MRMILGLDAPTQGSVTVGGRCYRDLPAPKREVGALLDAKALHGGRRACDHLAMPGRSNGRLTVFAGPGSIPGGVTGTPGPFGEVRVGGSSPPLGAANRQRLVLSGSVVRHVHALRGTALISACRRQKRPRKAVAVKLHIPALSASERLRRSGPVSRY